MACWVYTKGISKNGIGINPVPKVVIQHIAIDIFAFISDDFKIFSKENILLKKLFSLLMFKIIF